MSRTKNTERVEQNAMLRVFLSWSGERAKGVATALHEWLPCVFQDVIPWMSDIDIAAGVQWGATIGQELAASDYGVLCLTVENMSSPWVLYEAGALAKAFEEARVVPYRLGLKPSEVRPPLSQLQGVDSDREGTFKLARSINDCRARAFPLDRLERIFDQWWPTLNDQLAAVPAHTGLAPPARDLREMIEEVLGVVRRIAMPMPYDWLTGLVGFDLFAGKYRDYNNDIYEKALDYLSHCINYTGEDTVSYRQLQEMKRRIQENFDKACKGNKDYNN